MTLEDFFKGKGPDNYVEYPPKEAPSLEQFFAERTPVKKTTEVLPVKSTAKAVEPEIKAVSDVAPKLTPEDVDRLSSQFSLQPSISSSTMGNETQQMPTLPPATNTVSTEDQFKAYDTLINQMKEVKPEVSWSEALLGLLPVGLEAITGGTGAGLKVGADYYNKKAEEVKKKQATLESKITDLQKAKLLEMLKEPKTVEVNVGGKPIITPVRQGLGKEAWKSAAKAGLSYEDKLKLAQVGEKGKESRQEKAIKIATRDKVASNKEFVAARSSYGSANQAVNILNGKTWAGDAGIPSLFAKGIFKEVGAMSDSDKVVFLKDPALVNQFDSVYEKYLDPTKGTYNDSDRAVLMKVALNIRDRAKKEANMVASGYIEGLASEGIDASNLVKPLLKYDDTKPDKTIINYGTPKLKRLSYEEFVRLRRQEKLKGK